MITVQEFNAIDSFDDLYFKCDCYDDKEVFEDIIDLGGIMSLIEDGLDNMQDDLNWYGIDGEDVTDWLRGIEIAHSETGYYRSLPYKIKDIDPVSIDQVYFAPLTEQDFLEVKEKARELFVDRGYLQEDILKGDD